MKDLAVYEAICNVQSGLASEGISKANKNKQQGYMFRGIDDIYNALSKLISKNGLCILPNVISRESTERPTAKGGVLFYVIVQVEFNFVSSKDGSSHKVTTFGEAMDSGDKATNKAMSAAYKYACLQTFCIPTEGDNDADSTTHEVQSRHQPIADEIENMLNEGMFSECKEKWSILDDRVKAELWKFNLGKEAKATMKSDAYKEA